MQGIVVQKKPAYSISKFIMLLCSLYSNKRKEIKLTVLM